MVWNDDSNCYISENTIMEELQKLLSKSGLSVMRPLWQGYWLDQSVCLWSKERLDVESRQLKMNTTLP